MTSFISHFKLPVAVVGSIVLIEIVISVVGTRPSKHDTNFLEFAYQKKEVMQKYVVFEKLRTLPEFDAEFVAVGDSSEWFGVQPLVVMEYLQGLGFVNLGVSQDTQWSGYRHIARYYLEQGTKAKHLILYFSPYGLPLLISENHILPSARLA